MSLPQMSGVGRLTGDPEIRYAASGVAILTVNLAFNSRKRDAGGNWVDGDVFFVRGTAFKSLAENASDSLTKGMEVCVSGRLKTEQWQDKQTGEKRSAVSLLIDAIGPNLAFASARVSKAERRSEGAAHGSSGTSAAAGGDPWADVPPPDEQPPF